MARDNGPFDECMRTLGIGGVQQLISVFIVIPDDGGLGAADLPDDEDTLVQRVLNVGRAVDDGLNVTDRFKMLE